MKNLKQYINESQQINESSIFSAFDLSFVVLISSLFSALTSLGITVTGNIIKQWLSSKHHASKRAGKNAILMQLKDLTRSIPDIEDKPALAVLNNPGEWDSTMIDELRRALFSKMTPEQIQEFERLEKNYLSTRNKFYSI